MNLQAPEWRDPEKIRQQFDYGPYPRIPLEGSPKEDYNDLYRHNLITSYYLRHRKVTDTHNKIILDAGCGSGFKSLILAEANPGAKIVGIDLSEQSLNLARQRLKYHGFENAEFHQLKIEEVAQLGMEYDYINCDEVLYLLPDPVLGLQAMKSVLKSDGLIRTNLHNALQRADFYRAQTLFKLLGLMDENPEEFAEQAVVETMKALRNGVNLKATTWSDAEVETMQPERLREMLLTNFLLIGDTGYTIPDLFLLLEQADLEFVSMVDWRQWDVTDLFKEPDNLPFFLGISLANATVQDKLRVYELLNPVHRLMDFWCTHPGTAGTTIDDWSDADWQTAIVHLHPQLRTDSIKAELISCIQQAKLFQISRRIPLPALTPVMLEPTQAACLLPLWDGPQPIGAMAERYRQIRPVDPVTLEPVSETAAFETVKDLLNRLDAFLYVLLERS